MFGPSQGRIVRAVVLYLLNRRHKSELASIVIESIVTQPWATLTFTGERHRLVVRLAEGKVPVTAIEAGSLIVPGLIVAVERAHWETAADGATLTLDLLAIAPPPLASSPNR